MEESQSLVDGVALFLLRLPLASSSSSSASLFFFFFPAPEVDNLEGIVARLRQGGMRFRNDILVGPGGRQILLDDPSGNAIELFEAK